MPHFAYHGGGLLHHLLKGPDPGQKAEPVDTEADLIHGISQRRQGKGYGKGCRAGRIAKIMLQGVILPLKFEAQGAYWLQESDTHLNFSTSNGKSP